MDASETRTPVSRRAQLTAAAVGFGFCVAAWLVVVVSLWSGLLWAMPREYGGVGLGEFGGYVGIGAVGVSLASLVLAAVYGTLRAGGVQRPAMTTAIGSVGTVVLCLGFLFLTSIAFPDGPATPLLGACPVLGSFVFVLTARR